MNDQSNLEFKDTQLPGDEEQRRPRNHIWAGLFVLCIGVVLLLRQSGVELPFWLFTWPMILIAVGLLGGIKQRFTPGGWMIVLLVGGIFLADNLIPGVSIQKFAWPLLLMVIGFWIIVRPKTHHRHFGKCYKNRQMKANWESKNETEEDEYMTKDGSDFIDATSVFGGVKKMVLSKNFKGGDIVDFMGGTEINLTQADIQGRISIDSTNIFGGTKLIVPPTWDVQSDVVAIFGGVDDKRKFYNEMPDPTKVVKLSGTCIFGGIEIKSF